MRQRNDTGHVQDVMAWPTDDHPDQRPFTAAPGEVVDHPTLLAGFTPLDAAADPDPAPGVEPDAAADTAPAKPPKTRSRNAAPAADTEDGEPQ